MNSNGEDIVFRGQITKTKRITLNNNNVIDIFEYSIKENDYIYLGSFHSKLTLQVLPFSDDCFIVNTYKEIKVVSVFPPFDAINTIVHNVKKISLVAKISEEIVVQVSNNCEFKFWNIKNGLLQRKKEYLFDRSTLKMKKKKEIEIPEKENTTVGKVFLRNDCNRPYSIAVKRGKVFVSYPTKIVVFNINTLQIESIIRVEMKLQIFEIRSECIIYQTLGGLLYSMNMITYKIEKKNDIVDKEKRSEDMNYSGNVIIKGLLYRIYKSFS